MRLHGIFLALVVVLACLATSPVAAQTTPTPSANCEFPVTLVDGGGTTVTIDDEPQRVVSLNPSAAQTMWEIGAREKVVGVSEYAAYLEGASERTIVSGETDIVMFERVVDLEPDLVLAPNTVPNESVERLRDAGLTVYHSPPAITIDDVYSEVRTIGQLTGECDGAEDTVSWMQEEIQTVERAVDGERRPDALYLFYGYTAGNDTFVHELIETAGGNNIAADVGIAQYQQISHEVIIDADPEWIILNSDDPAVPREEAFNATTAVQEDQIVIIPIEYLNQPAPRIVYAITNLTEAFHPDAYAAAQTTSTPTSQSPPSPTTPSPTETQPATETPGQHGFGLVLPVVALLFLVLGRVSRN